MPLDILYIDPDTKEESELFIKVVLSRDFTNESTTTEHPSETRKSFTDNSLDNLKDVPITIFVPDVEELEDGSIRTKESVLEILEKLRVNAVVITNLVINNKFYYNLLLNKISGNETINTGDSWDLQLLFKEIREVSSTTTSISEAMIATLKAARAAAEAKDASLLAGNTSALSKVNNSISNLNKTSNSNNKGTVKTGVDKFLDKTSSMRTTLVKVDEEKYTWVDTVTQQQKDATVEILKNQYNVSPSKFKSMLYMKDKTTGNYVRNIGGSI